MEELLEILSKIGWHHCNDNGNYYVYFSIADSEDEADMKSKLAFDLGKKLEEYISLNKERINEIIRLEEENTDLRIRLVKSTKREVTKEDLQIKLHQLSERKKKVRYEIAQLEMKLTSLDHELSGYEETIKQTNLEINDLESKGVNE